MHEYSIVADLIAQCERYAHEHKARVDTVVVGIGERCGVNAQLLATAFENYKEGSCLQSSKLEIKQIPIIISCMECGMRYEPLPLEYGQCKGCKSVNVRIVEGEDMLLLRLEMDKD